MRKSLLLRSFFAVVAGTVASLASAQISGAIYDTDITGTNVNQNQYDQCDWVYLNGGPQNENSQGLPPGEYFYQVTDPSGSVLLSADNVRNRRLLVALTGADLKGRIVGPLPDPTDSVSFPGHVNPPTGLTYPGFIPDHNTEATFNPANSTTGVHLWPFYETPNGGGVYKIWIVKVEEYDWANENSSDENFGFKSGQTKTDNFGCVHGNGFTPLVELSGTKWYDVDHDGARDLPEDFGILGWQIHIIGTQGGDPVDETITTDPDGNWRYELDSGSTYEICEIMPEADPAWTRSYPSGAGGDCYEGTVPEEDTSGFDFGNYRAADFSGEKFYDLDADGVNDASEVGVGGIRINVYVDDGTGEALFDPLGQGYTTLTDSNGNWSVSINLYDSENYTFRIEEVIPGTGDPDCTWLQTAPASGNYTVTTSSIGLDFGNVCICRPTNGRTLGFWSNKNGQAILKNNDPAWRTLLNALHLRKANGSDYDVPVTTFATAYGNFRTWLLSATAVNMAYMLSAQLAANVLNTAYIGLGSGDIVLLTPELAECWGSNTATVGAIQAAAETLLIADGFTPDGDPLRDDQECIKNILDAINNNWLPIIHGTPCNVIY